MTEKFNAGAAPVSKYAAKQRAKFNGNVKPTVQMGIKNDQNAPAEENTNAGKFFKKKFKRNYDDNFINRLPEHLIQLVLVVKNNSEIRRFTSHGIKNYLKQKGIIKEPNAYVSFKWTKFSVKENGLIREFSYNEPFFINALIASFASFSASAQRTIDEFCYKELNKSISEAADSDEIQNIVDMNAQYLAEKAEVEVQDEPDTEPETESND